METLFEMSLVAMSLHLSIIMKYSIEVITSMYNFVLVMQSIVEEPNMSKVQVYYSSTYTKVA